MTLTRTLAPRFQPSATAGLVVLLAVLVHAVPGCERSDAGALDADFTFISGATHNTLDPQKMSWAHDIRLARCLYEPLVLFDFTSMQLEPGVAERWSVSDDGLTYTFHLRDDARWSNGDRLTANDFVFAWRRLILPDMAADYSKLMFDVAGAEDFFAWRQEQLRAFAAGELDETPETLYDRALAHFDDTVGLDAPDPKTLVVTLARPTPYFLELVAFTPFVPVHRESVTEASSFSDESAMLQVDPTYWADPDQLVTNGPYRLADRRFRQYVYLVANDHYHARDRMRNASVLERIVEHPSTALQTYQRGGADFFPDVPTGSELAADLVNSESPDVHVTPAAGTYFYNFNCLPQRADGSPNPLHDPRVRRALSMAIDRQLIVERVTRLHQPVARTYIPLGVLADYDPPVEHGVTFDPDRARQLLAEAGHEDGRGLSGLTLLYNTNAGHDAKAQAVAAMWEKHLGVVVRLEGIEVRAFAERLKQKTYDIARAAWFGDYPDPTTWLGKMRTGDGNNDCGWSNPDFDALLDRAALERDPEQRMKLLRDAEIVLLRDQPMALIHQYINLFLFDPERVRGLRMNPWRRWRFERVEVLP